MSDFLRLLNRTNYVVVGVEAAEYKKVTTIPVSEETLRKLWLLKREKKFRSYDELINYLINVLESKTACKEL